ncbi:MAG: monovalent cation:proton antiporter-2 (CPA2) family protein, partial [Arenicellales bacterium]
MDILLQTFVFLAAGVIAVPIASRLGLGSVLGYLIAGAVIGPFVLGLVAEPADVMHFAEFGVVMMLFLIGLELKPEMLWRLRVPILGLGGLQVILTTAVITALAMLFGMVWQTALTIGLVLSLSSTAIALQILNEKNMMSTEAGKASFAVLLFQDIAVIPIIALLPLLALMPAGTAEVATHGGSRWLLHLSAWQHALVDIAAVLMIIVLGRYVLRPVFRFIAVSGLREMFTALALLLVIGIALLMQSVGLSPALGTFVAGVVLANSEYRHELEANIDPFKALLLGLFFISVGAAIDFGLIGQEPIKIIGFVLALVAIKFVILWVIAKVFHVNGGNRYWFTFALAQGGEFGFVLLSLATQSHVLEQGIVETLTVVIALSMVLTPILMAFNEKIVQPKFQIIEAEAPADDFEDQHNPVIIAGFGRVGQIVGRILLANKIPTTVLDHSATHIERVRTFGFKIFFGDAKREDLLAVAGAGDAKLLVVAVDDRNTITSIVKTAQHYFPNLKIYARAYDLTHYHELSKLGVDYIEREVFRS